MTGDQSPILRITSLTLPEPLPTVTVLHPLLRLLSPTDAAQYHHYHHLEDKFRFLGGRLLLRRAIERLQKQHNGDGQLRLSEGEAEGFTGWDEVVHLSAGVKGKPFLKEPHTASLIDFNISHDTSVVLLATLEQPSQPLPSPSPSTSDSMPTAHPAETTPTPGFSVDASATLGKGCVGVDIMRLDRSAEGTVGMEEALLDQLTSNEIDSLPGSHTPHAVSDADHASNQDNAPPSSRPSRLDRILELWTLKEAYVKALGVGLSMDLRRINVDFMTEKVLPEGAVKHRKSGKGESSEDASPGCPTEYGVDFIRKPFAKACDLCVGRLAVAVDGNRLEAATGWHASSGRVWSRKSAGSTQAGLRGGELPHRGEGGLEGAYAWAVVWRIGSIAFTEALSVEIRVPKCSEPSVHGQCIGQPMCERIVWADVSP